MTPRFVRLVVSVVALTATAHVSSNALPACPRSLHDVLASSACEDGVDGAILDHACATALHAWRQTTPPDALPCSATVGSILNHGDAPHDRRLSTSTTRRPFKGQIQCRFDTAVPVNAADLTQGFEVECEKLVDPFDYVLLGIVILVVVLVGIICTLLMRIPKVRAYVEQQRERWRQQREQQQQQRRRTRPRCH